MLSDHSYTHIHTCSDSLRDFSSVTAFFSTSTWLLSWQGRYIDRRDVEIEEGKAKKRERKSRDKEICWTVH